MQPANAAHRTAATGRYADVVLDANAVLTLGLNAKPARVRITGIAGSSYRFIALDAIRRSGRTVAAGTPGIAPQRHFSFTAPEA